MNATLLQPYARYWVNRTLRYVAGVPWYTTDMGRLMYNPLRTFISNGIAFALRDIQDARISYFRVSGPYYSFLTEVEP